MEFYFWRCCVWFAVSTTKDTGGSVISVYLFTAFGSQKALFPTHPTFPTPVMFMRMYFIHNTSPYKPSLCRQGQTIDYSLPEVSYCTSASLSILLPHIFCDPAATYTTINILRMQLITSKLSSLSYCFFKKCDFVLVLTEWRNVVNAANQQVLMLLQKCLPETSKCANRQKKKKKK